MAGRDANRIIQIPMGACNAYIVANNRRAILIDAGMKKKEEKIRDALQHSHISIADLQLIVLTHTHYDHCGSLKALQSFTKAKVLVHKAEAENLRQGYRAFPKGTMWFSRIVSAIGRAFAKKLGAYPPVSPDITISKRFDLSGYGIDGYIVPTPGHTAGSISVVIAGKHAIVGDTLFNIFKKGVFPPYADDQAALLRSWKKLLVIGCEYFYPGHGRPFTRAKLKKNYEEMSR
jgi:glyoxylase-like metal-dependent hydrolase (beta-lactamase superfamily II)